MIHAYHMIKHSWKLSVYHTHKQTYTYIHTDKGGCPPPTSSAKARPRPDVAPVITACGDNGTTLHHIIITVCAIITCLLAVFIPSSFHSLFVQFSPFLYYICHILVFITLSEFLCICYTAIGCTRVMEACVQLWVGSKISKCSNCSQGTCMHSRSSIMHVPCGLKSLQEQSPTQTVLPLYTSQPIHMSTLFIILFILVLYSQQPHMDDCFRRHWERQGRTLFHDHWEAHSSLLDIWMQ